MKTDAAKAAARERPEADATARKVPATEPRAAAHDPRYAFPRLQVLALRVGCIVGIGTLNAARPFPDVANHVKETEAIGCEAADHRRIADLRIAIVRAFGIGVAWPRKCTAAQTTAPLSPT